MKKIKVSISVLIDELDFTHGQVKLTIAFCLLSAGIGILGSILNGFATIIAFGVLVLIWSVSMFDINWHGIPREEFKRTQKKPETAAAVSDNKQNISKEIIAHDK